MTESAITPVIEVQWFGDRAVMVTCVDREQRAEVALLLRHRFGERSVRSGMVSVLVEVAMPDVTLRQSVLAALDARGDDSELARPVPHLVVIDVRYDGPDLQIAADAMGLTSQSLANAHANQQWMVAMIGFAPGFGYLVPSGEATASWADLPRRRSPREQVPRGSVAIAAGMSAVYPGQMPGGWHLIGCTDAVMFDAENSAHPSLLEEGNLVRFRSCT